MKIQEEIRNQETKIDILNSEVYKLSIVQLQVKDTTQRLESELKPEVVPKNNDWIKQTFTEILD